MDLSKANRADIMKTAMAAVTNTNGKNTEIMPLAREMALFMADKDPVIDLPGRCATDNVTLFNEAFNGR